MKRSSIIIKRAFSLLIVLAAGLSVFTLVAFVYPLVYAQAAQPATRYLAPTGLDTGNDCSQPAKPCATLQHSLLASQPNDLILAAAGMYSDVVVSDGVTQVAVISQPITIRGGYTAVFTDPPDPKANLTIFDVRGEGRVLTILDAGHVTLEGLVLTGGRASGQYDRGGGLYARNSQITISSSTISHNKAGYGGGLYLQNSQAALWQNEISQNEATFSGGGVRCYGCTGLIQQNQIMSNTAVLNGGGLQITASPVTLAANLIQNNETAVSSQGWGGGVHLQNSGETQLRQNLIQQNRAFSGGGLRLYNSPALLQGNVIRDNQASWGGGLMLEKASQAVVENNAFIANSADSQGDGLSILNSAPQLQHNTFNGNGETAVYSAGSAPITLSNSLIANQQWGVVNEGSAISLTTTLWDNVLTPTLGLVSDTNSLSGTAAFSADGYHLSGSSAALNQAEPGSTAIDIDRQQRPHYGGFDIGADEWWPLDATKHASAYAVQPGLRVTYTIILTNYAQTAAPFWLTDTLPAQVDFLGPVSATTGSAGFNSGVVSWQGSLPPASSAALSWPVQIAAAVQPGTVITNSAEVQDELGIYNTTTAVMIVPVQIYLPIIITQSTD